MTLKILSGNLYIHFKALNHTNKLEIEYTCNNIKFQILFEKLFYRRISLKVYKIKQVGHDHSHKPLIPLAAIFQALSAWHSIFL